MQVPNASITDAIRSWPLILGSSTSKLKLMVDRFGELGVRSKKLGQVIATSPQILLQKPQEFLQVGTYYYFPPFVVSCIPISVKINSWILSRLFIIDSKLIYPFTSSQCILFSFFIVSCRFYIYIPKLHRKYYIIIIAKYTDNSF